MWVTFALAVVAGAAFLYGPGILALRALRFPWRVAIPCAPFLMLLAYALLAIGYEWLGVASSWVTLFWPALAVGAAAFAVSWALSRRRGALDAPAGRSEDGGGWRALGVALAYLAVGVVVGVVVFAASIGDPSASIQEYDNVHHLGEIRGFMETGRWSSLSVSLYPSEADGAFDPWATVDFYPSAWHCLVAMIAGATGAELSVAVNASLFLLSFVVFPQCVLLLLGVLFRERPMVVVMGACCTLAFASFPWGLLTFGPLYPNLASFVVLPAVAACFLLAFEEGEAPSRRVLAAALFVAGLASLALLQPNAVFTVGVLLAPFCARSAMRLERFVKVPEGRRRLVRALLCCGFLLVAALVWALLYNAPFMQSVVSHAWPSFASLHQALINVLTLALRHSAVQPVLGGLVLVGAAFTLYRRQYVWLTGSYAFACLMYVACARADGVARFVLTGFWYTDPFRIAAMVALFAIPLAALGLYCCAHGLRWCLAKAAQRAGSGAWAVALAGPLAGLLFLSMAFCPSFELPGWGPVRTGMGVVREHLQEEYAVDASRMYDQGEQEFVEEAMELLPEGAVVVNDPNDGSAFAYGLDGLNVVYRYLSGYGGSGESSASRVIRERLDDVGTDEEVREALRQTGVRYVLLLDQGPDQASQPHLWTYRPEQWPGLNGIDDGTPGFEKVLSRGDMRLYRITALDEEG